MDKVSWGILSTANIGVEKVIPAMQKARHCTVSALASRTLDKAQAAAGKLRLPKAYGSYEALLADPDIDAVYMAACQMLTGSGGWPLSIFMTPQKKPFFAATYLPKKTRHGRAGLIDICRQVQDLWSNQNEKIETSAESIASNLDRAFTFAAADEPDADAGIDSGTEDQDPGDGDTLEHEKDSGGVQGNCGCAGAASGRRAAIFCILVLAAMLRKRHGTR